MLYKRTDFPILNRLIHGKNLVYLDSAATSLKPHIVIDSIVTFYKQYSANIHRGIYQISEKSTQRYEEVRKKVARLINVASEEVIFVRNTTEAINLVAKVWGERNIKKNSKIVLSLMEHHSNLIPWQELARKKGAKLVFIDINDNGELNLNNLDDILQDSSLLAITHVSNMLGTINPIKILIRKAHQAGAKVLIDGAQAVPHMPVNINELDCDFYAFSGHKMLGPSGVGVLWMKKNIAQVLPPFLTGGGMVKSVTTHNTNYLDLPYKYEAGTPNIEGVIGLGAAIDYLNHIEMTNIRIKEEELTDYALKKLRSIVGLTIYGSLETRKRGGIISFNVAGIHPHDLASILDQEGIAVRAGHHCTILAHKKLGISSSVRLSLYFYNEKKDIDKFAETVIQLSRTL